MKRIISVLRNDPIMCLVGAIVFVELIILGLVIISY
jgi:hypothetical protein